jgi:uncharacterized membrane protein YhaH (DUF805 family)
MSDATLHNHTGGVAFKDAIKTGFSKYATFDGRAPRSEFWFWVLFTVLASAAAGIVDRVLGLNFLEDSAGPFAALFNLLVLIPSLAVGARRLHDIDRSGWWQLLGLVPVIGWIVLVVFFVTRGTAGSNRFGPDPLA